jgi:hypothetical protein
MFKQFMTFVGSIFEDQTGGGSSKRVVLLWVAVPIWTLVHWFVFKGEDHELKSTLIMYDFFLITGFGGLALAEKSFNNKVADTSESKGEPK